MNQKIVDKIMLGVLACSAMSAQAYEFRASGFLNTAAGYVAGDRVLKTQLHPGASGARLADYYQSYEKPSIADLHQYPELSRETVVGLQFDGEIDDQFSAHLQFTCDGSQEYNAKVSWLYGKWQMNDKMSFRAGRFRNPLFMLSEYLQVGFVHPWVRPPLEAYSLVPINLSNTTAVDMYYTSDIYGLDYSIGLGYGGGRDKISYAPGTESTLEAVSQYFSSFNIGTFDWKFSVNYTMFKISAQDMPSSILAYNVDNPAGGIPPLNPDDIEVISTSAFQSSYFASIGFTYDANNIVFLTEFVRRSVGGWISDNNGFYATAGYRYGNILPSITFGRLVSTDKATLKNLQANVIAGVLEVPAVVKNSLIDNQYNDTESFGFDLKWTPKPFIALKGAIYQYKAINGTIGLFDVAPKNNKATVISLGLNLLF